MSQFTIDVLELAVKQGRAVTNSTMLSLAIAKSSLNKREYDKKSYDAAVVFAASMQPPLLDEWVRACYANRAALSNDFVEFLHRAYPERRPTSAYSSVYGAALSLQVGFSKHRAAQRQILDNLIDETYEILEKEKV